MTTTFTASNGDTIETRHDGYLVVKDGHYTEWLSPCTVDTLREYFTAERDTELGRWRDPETGLLVYQINDDPDTVFVFDETYADHGTWTREQVGPTTTGFGAPIAERYFAAHPEPKPWESAEEGEMWLITCGAGYKNAPAIVKDGNFYFPNRFGGGLDFIDLEGVMTATRIWPTEESDDE